jgi:hypothetical protein
MDDDLLLYLSLFIIWRIIPNTAPISSSGLIVAQTYQGQEQHEQLWFPIWRLDLCGAIS